MLYSFRSRYYDSSDLHNTDSMPGERAMHISPEELLYWKTRAEQAEKTLAEERGLREEAQLLVMKLKAGARHPVRCEDCWIAWAAKKARKRGEESPCPIF